MENGSTSEIGNITGYEDFKAFASENVDYNWLVFNDMTINMKKVIKFWEVK